MANGSCTNYPLNCFQLSKVLHLPLFQQEVCTCTNIGELHKFVYTIQHLAKQTNPVKPATMQIANIYNINQGKEREMSPALYLYQLMIFILKILKSRSPISVHGKQDHRTRVTASTPIASTPMNLPSYVASQ